MSGDFSIGWSDDTVNHGPWTQRYHLPADLPPFYIRAEDLELNADAADFRRITEEIAEERDRAVLDAMDRELWHSILFGPEKRQESAGKRLVALTLDRLDALAVRLAHTLIRLGRIGRVEHTPISRRSNARCPAVCGLGRHQLQRLPDPARCVRWAQGPHRHTVRFLIHVR